MRSLAISLMFLPTAGYGDHELLNRDLALGAELYAESCATCHGTDLQGQPNWRAANEDGVFPAPPHDETGHTWHHDNALLFEYTKLGGKGALAARGMANVKSGMPAFDGVISDDNIWNILAYIRSTWPPRLQQSQASRNQSH